MRSTTSTLRVIWINRFRSIFRLHCKSDQCCRLYFSMFPPHIYDTITLYCPESNCIGNIVCPLLKHKHTPLGSCGPTDPLHRPAEGVHLCVLLWRRAESSGQSPAVRCTLSCFHTSSKLSFWNTSIQRKNNTNMFITRSFLFHYSSVLHVGSATPSESKLSALLRRLTLSVSASCCVWSAISWSFFASISIL